MKTIYYDHQFNSNEWFIVVVLLVGAAALYVLPRRFSRQLAIIFYSYGVYCGLFFDHLISIVPFDYYDVNDSSNYTIADFFTYIMYGPFSYVFVYLNDRWKITAAYIPLYILLWSMISMAMELAGWKLGVYHYKNGYNIFYSFPIYLLMQCVLIAIYHALVKRRS